MTTTTHPRRGDVWWVNFEPAVGGEVQKLRPAVVVSNDASNAVMNRVQVVPVTSNVRRVFTSEALVTLPQGPRKAMADQIKTAAKERLGGYIGRVSTEEMRSLERAVRVQLGL